MNPLLFDDELIRPYLFPFSFTRPICEVRCGILTVREKWQKYFNQPVFYLTEDYLLSKYIPKLDKDNLIINGGLIPSPEIFEAIINLEDRHELRKGEQLLASRCPMDLDGDIELIDTSENASQYPGEVTLIRNLSDIFLLNPSQIVSDLKLIEKERKNHKITDPHTIIYNPENVFAEEGVVTRAAVINAEGGPVYIGKNAFIAEGAVIQGPAAICEGARINPGAVISGGSTIGPYSKAGGEIHSSVIHGYSNKSHEGYLGHSVIGEWCNIGAGSNTSNLKNNYKNIKVWDYDKKELKDTEQQFFGMMMGDHTKCGINTMFNTGTVIGPASNVFGPGFLPKHIPPFSWGGSESLETHEPEAAIETAKKVMQRRGKTFDENDRIIFDTVYTELIRSR